MLIPNLSHADGAKTFVPYDVKYIHKNSRGIKDLKVKGAGATLKRGTMAKNIKLTGNDKEVECRIDKMGVIVLKTEFLKKA